MCGPTHIMARLTCDHAYGIEAVVLADDVCEVDVEPLTTGYSRINLVAKTSEPGA